MEQTIGKYKILRELGKGGMGIVYKGLDPVTQKSVAVKVLPVSMVERTTVERFNREAAAMARVKHPNLVEVYEVGMTKGQHFYAMEYIDGDTLKAIIKQKGALPVSACLDIVLQISAALACIHQAGMIHRDIKPGNIMINSEAKAKLMDFGLVQLKDATRVTIEGASVGTAEYMSPEQISEDEVDTRSDIYSLGATMFEMLTGRPPFEGGSFQSVLMKHKYEAPPCLRKLRPEIPACVEQIVLKALSKDVKQRYQKIQELLDDIRQLKETTAIRVEAPVIQKEAVKKENSVIRVNINIAPFLFGVIILGVAGYFGYTKSESIRTLVSNFLTRSQSGARQENLTEETQDHFKRLELAEQHYVSAQEYDQQEQYDKAIGEYKKAITLRNDYGLYYYDLALAYKKKADMRNSIKTWQDLLKYAPSSSYASLAQAEIEKLAQDK